MKPVGPEQYAVMGTNGFVCGIMRGPDVMAPAFYLYEFPYPSLCADTVCRKRKLINIT
jgi:hypothetical protein